MKDPCEYKQFVCDDNCVPYLDGCRLQLNPGAFFKEAYCRQDGVDPNAEYVSDLILNVFGIVDEVTPPLYCFVNYSSIMNDEFKSQMDLSVMYEQSVDKISVVPTAPHCVHCS